MLPGFEIIGKEEKSAVNRLFEEGKIFFAHGFDNKRKHFHVREFETELKSVFAQRMSQFWLNTHQPGASASLTQ